MNTQEAINTAMGSYLSYLIYGDSNYLLAAEHWFYYASWAMPSIRFSTR